MSSCSGETPLFRQVVLFVGLVTPIKSNHEHLGSHTYESQTVFHFKEFQNEFDNAIGNRHLCDKNNYVFQVKKRPSMLLGERLAEWGWLWQFGFCVTCLPVEVALRNP